VSPDLFGAVIGDEEFVFDNKDMLRAHGIPLFGPRDAQVLRGLAIVQIEID
jgi:hypothetical protein